MSVCDGQTPPNRRRKSDEWGTPGLLDILSRSSLGHPPVSVRAGQTRPTRRKVRDDVGHPRFIRYTQPFMAGPPANSPVPRICTESGNRAFGSQHRRVVQVNERKKPGRGRETFPRLFFAEYLISEPDIWRGSGRLAFIHPAQTMPHEQSA